MSFRQFSSVINKLRNEFARRSLITLAEVLMTNKNGDLIRCFLDLYDIEQIPRHLVSAYVFSKIFSVITYPCGKFARKSVPWTNAYKRMLDDDLDLKWSFLAPLVLLDTGTHMMTSLVERLVDSCT